MVLELQKEVKSLQNTKKAKFLAGFFKTGKGEYADGDVFYGLTVPQSRKIAMRYKNISLREVKILLRSAVHEERLIAILILVFQFEKGDERFRGDIFKLYLSHTKFINNWDLVDLSAPRIVGGYLQDKERNVLLMLAKSQDLWEKRISILATLYFIVKLNEYKDTFQIADVLLYDKHDLIHKAVGWMLREVGKRVSQEKEEEFLKARYKTMPRTALRYAIERFSEEKRKKYLLGQI